MAHSHSLACPTLSSWQAPLSLGALPSLLSRFSLVTSQDCLPALDLYSLVTSQRCLPTLDLCPPLFSGGFTALPSITGSATLLSGDFTALPSNAGPLSPSLSWGPHVALLFGARSGQQSFLAPYHGPPELPLSAQTWNTSPSQSNYPLITSLSYPFKYS